MFITGYLKNFFHANNKKVIVKLSFSFVFFLFYLSLYFYLILFHIINQLISYSFLNHEKDNELGNGQTEGASSSSFASNGHHSSTSTLSYLKSSKSFRNSKNTSGKSSSDSKNRPYQIDKRNALSSLDVSTISSPTISSSSKLTPSVTLNKQPKLSTPFSTTSRLKSTPSPDTDSVKTNLSNKLPIQSANNCKRLDNQEDISITNDYYIDDDDDLSSSDLESSFPDIEIAEIVEQASNSSKIKPIDSMNKFKPIADTKPSLENRYSPMIKKPASPKKVKSTFYFF